MGKKGERRNQILSIALNEFVTKGYYGTSTREISKIAGISSGLMFHYFESKDALFHELVKIGTEKMIFDTKTAEKNPKEYLTGLVEEIFRQLQDNIFFARMFAFIDAALYTSGIPDNSKYLLERTNIGHQLIPLIVKGQEIGQFREGNPQALATAFFGAIQGIAQEKVHTPDATLPEVQWIMDIICI